MRFPMKIRRDVQVSPEIHCTGDAPEEAANCLETYRKLLGNVPMILRETAQNRRIHVRPRTSGSLVSPTNSRYRQSGD